jgi:lysophospholipase L1-like esterase
MKMFESLSFSKSKLVVLATAIIISGCGGSSGNKEPPPPPPPQNNAPTANAGPDQTVGRDVTVTLDGSGSSDSDGTIASYAWSQTAGTGVGLSDATAQSPTFTSPADIAGGVLTFSLTVTDDDGATSTADTVDITVSANEAPTADAGADQTVSSLETVTLDGSASADADGTIVAYTWSQTTGTEVTLDETVASMPTFEAPNVGADEVLTFELVVTDNEGAPSLADSVVVTINPTLALPFSDNFNDGNFDGWTIVDDNITFASTWDASSNRMVNNNQTHRNFGDLDETYHRGTYAYLADSVNLTNYRFEVDITQRDSSLEDLGVMFRYSDNDHYYRFSMNSSKGFARLESKAGVDGGGDPIWRTLRYDHRGYEPGTPVNVIVEVDGPLIQIFVNGDDLFAVYDEDHALGGIALYARDGIRFDNVAIDVNDPNPEIVIAEPVANTVVPSGPRDIEIVAIARNIPPGGAVTLEFTGEPACGAVTETNPGEFRAVCANRAVGNHEVVAEIFDGGTLNRDRNVDVYLGMPGFGDRYEAIGDSLTLGLRDNFARDNLNLNDRKTISASGWSGPLSDLLTTSQGAPNLVANEGISGDRASEMRIFHLPSILQRNRRPKGNRALLMLGTNDAVINASSTPAEYENDMTQIINSVLNSGREMVYVAILPPVFANNNNAPLYEDPLDFNPASPTYAERNANIDSYNQVVINNLVPLPNVELGPDLFSCFVSPTVNRFSLFEDALHMNGLGYAFVAALWHDAIQVGPPTPGDPCPSPIFILEDLDPYTHELKQNLLEAGDPYYRDEAFVLTNVPPELADGVWVSQNNADRANQDAGFMSFDVGADPVTVYIAYDAAGGPPTSSEIFVASTLSENLTVDDPAVQTFTVIEAAGVTGVVTIGGTDSDLSGIARQAYVVIVVP